MLTLALLTLAAAAKTSTDLPPAAAIFVAGNDGAGRVELELAKALKKKNVDLADVDALFPAPSPESADEGSALFTKGREAYDNLDFDASIKALSDAAIFFIKHPTAAKAEQLSEIFLFLAASELQNGAKDDAAKDFARALQMNPALAPDKKYFGADVQGGFSAAQKELASRAKGKLSITTYPAGAEVQSGTGTSYGKSPVADIELAAGRFMVRVTRPGFNPIVTFPEVTAGATFEVISKLETALPYSQAIDKASKLINAKSFEDDNVPPPAVEIGKTMKTRFLVLVQASGDPKAPKCELQVWNLATGDRLKGVKFDGAPDAPAYDTAADAVSAWISRPNPVAGGDETGPSEGGGVLNQWWFWAGVGVVVIGGVGVTGGVLASQHSSVGFNPALGQP